VTDFHRLPIAGLPAHPSTASKPEVNPSNRLRLVAAAGWLAKEVPKSEHKMDSSHPANSISRL